MYFVRGSFLRGIYISPIQSKAIEMVRYNVRDMTGLGRKALNWWNYRNYFSSKHYGGSDKAAKASQSFGLWESDRKMENNSFLYNHHPILHVPICYCIAFCPNETRTYINMDATNGNNNINIK